MRTPVLSRNIKIQLVFTVIVVFAMPICAWHLGFVVYESFYVLKMKILSNQATAHSLILGFGSLVISIGGNIATLLFFWASLNDTRELRNRLDALP